MLDRAATDLPEDGGIGAPASRPALTFRVTLPTRATPEEVYDVLAQLPTHVTWCGDEAPRSNFRLLTIEAPARQAIAGDRFSSTGSNGSSTFSDRSVVVQADPGSRFGFDTEATLTRKHRPTWNAAFRHRYTIAPAADGATIAYVAEVRPENYRPYWLFPGMRPGTRVMVQRMMRANMENLARMAEEAFPRS
jgi:Polyketide cyclase / dehydrase and lipid transport